VPRLIRNGLNTGEALDRLANKGKGNASLAIAMHRTRIAHHGARRINPRITRTREFTGNQRIPRCISGRQDHGEGRQYRVPSQGRFKALIRKSGRGEAKDGRKEDMAKFQHVDTPLRKSGFGYHCSMTKQRLNDFSMMKERESVVTACTAGHDWRRGCYHIAQQAYFRSVPRWLKGVADTRRRGGKRGAVGTDAQGWPLPPR
jgi:hypothetical protein